MTAIAFPSNTLAGIRSISGRLSGAVVANAEGSPAGVLGTGDILGADGLTHRDARRFLSEARLVGAALCYGSDIITPDSVADSLADHFRHSGNRPRDIVLRSLGAVTYFDGLRCMQQKYPEVAVPLHRNIFMLSTPRSAGEIDKLLGLLPKIGWGEFWRLPGSIATELTGIKGASFSSVRQAIRNGIDTLPDKQTAAQWQRHPDLLEQTTPWGFNELAGPLVAGYTKVTMVGSKHDPLVRIAPAAERWASDFARQSIDMQYIEVPEVGHADPSPLNIGFYLN